MKKAQVDVAAQGESSTDSTSSAREVNSPTPRRKRVRHTEAEAPRVEITDESSIKPKTSQKRVSNKKTSKSKSTASLEQTKSEVGVSGVDVDALVFSENGDYSSDDFCDDDVSNDGVAQTIDAQDVQAPVAIPFPNETQFNASASNVYDDVPFDAQPSSDRFFCSDEKFYLDKFDEDVVDDFDDDFDEDFIQLDDMEFNETLDDSYEEGDDSFEYSDDEIDSDDSSDYEDFDKYDSDENVFEDADEGYPAP